MRTEILALFLQLLAGLLLLLVSLSMRGVLDEILSFVRKNLAHSGLGVVLVPLELLKTVLLEVNLPGFTGHLLSGLRFLAISIRIFRLELLLFFGLAVILIVRVVEEFHLNI